MEKTEQAISNQQEAKYSHINSKGESGKSIIRNKEICCITISDSIHWENVSILDVCPMWICV